jgi:hypothetical protein
VSVVFLSLPSLSPSLHSHAQPHTQPVRRLSPLPSVSVLLLTPTSFPSIISLSLQLAQLPIQTMSSFTKVTSTAPAPADFFEKPNPKVRRRSRRSFELRSRRSSGVRGWDEGRSDEAEGSRDRGRGVQ